MANCVRIIPNKLGFFNPVLFNRTSSNFSRFDQHGCTSTTNCHLISPTINKKMAVYKPENVKLINSSQKLKHSKYQNNDIGTLYPLQNIGFTPHSIVLWSGNKDNSSRKKVYLKCEAPILLLNGPASTDSSPPTNEKQSGPTNDQLDIVFMTLSEDLPRLFTTPLRFGIYRNDMIFENNIKGEIVNGKGPYMYKLSIFKGYAYLKYACVYLRILKITKHPEDATVRVRWTIKGIPGYRVIFTFWKFLGIDNLKKEVETADTWLDGFSIFYVGSDGLVYKHTADKMMPDDEKVGQSKKGNVLLKLGYLVGLSNQEQIFHCKNNTN